MVTTLQDNSSTRIASYSGCGCAGGEVVTLQDEGTTISSTLTRRKQKIYRDVLGRTVTAETYEWNGSTVYQMVATTYNVLDRPTVVRQFAGDDSSPTYQDTTYGYDGYGRLNSSQAPSQTSNTN